MPETVSRISVLRNEGGEQDRFLKRYFQDKNDFSGCKISNKIQVIKWQHLFFKAKA